MSTAAPVICGKLDVTKMGDVIRDEFKISIEINTDDIDDLNTWVKKWIEILKDTAQKDIKNLEQNSKTEKLKTKLIA